MFAEFINDKLLQIHPDFNFLILGICIREDIRLNIEKKNVKVSKAIKWIVMRGGEHLND